MRSRAFAMNFSRPTAFSSVQQLLPRLRFAKRTPNTAYETSLEARLYAARRRLRGHSAPAAFSSVRRIATPRLRFVRRNPKCSLPGFFQGTAVCRLQAFAMGFSRSTAFSSVQQLLPRPRFLPGAVPNVACQISSKVRPYTVRRRLHGHSAPGSVFVGTARRVPVLFLFQAKRHIARASPFPTLQQHGPVLATACFMKASKSADGSAMRQPYRQKAAFALFQTWNLQKWRWQRLCQMRMAVAANKKLPPHCVVKAIPSGIAGLQAAGETGGSPFTLCPCCRTGRVFPSPPASWPRAPGRRRRYSRPPDFPPGRACRRE